MTIQEDNVGELAGLLMVDRQKPVVTNWLREVEATYGGYQLVSMTAAGERGIACRMHIETESRGHLQRFPRVKSQVITKELEPFLEEPPEPVFNMWWDEEIRLWRSLIPAQMELSPEISQVFDNTGHGCLAAETDEATVHVCHASDTDIECFRDKPVRSQWQLIKMPTAPLIRLQLEVMDRPDDPYRFESFLNVAGSTSCR